MAKWQNYCNEISPDFNTIDIVDREAKLIDSFVKYLDNEFKC